MPSEFLQARHQARGWLRTAHRGAPSHAPDNTLESIRIAAAYPVDLVEIDVHLSCDGRLVLWHDEEIRIGDRVYPVRNQTLAELQALPVEGGLATLEQAIELVRGKAGLMVDLKAPDLQQPLMECFRSLEFYDLCVCGGYKSTLRAIRDQLPEVSVSLTPQLFEKIDFAEWDAVTVYWRMVNADFVQQAHQKGAWVMAWTVDDAATAQRLLQLGADGITSNHTEMLCGL